MYNPEGASETHQSVIESSRNTGIRPSPAGRFICDIFRDASSEENNVSK